MSLIKNKLKDKYRILSLDGGGSWALIQIRALQALYGQYAQGHQVLQNFDLIVANSGGSISAMALAENWTLDEIIKLYKTQEKREQIFVELNFAERRILRNAIKLLTGVGPKYKASAKLTGFEKIFRKIGKKSLKELPDYIGNRDTHFLIIGFDYDRERATFFRSDTASKAQTHIIAKEHGLATKSNFDDVTVAHALHASTNAPLNFFDEPAQFRYKGSAYTKRFWDGAVGGYNNPVMAGLTEALSNGVDLEEIRILSIGTGNTFLPLKDLNQDGIKESHSILCQNPEKPGLANDIRKMSISILSDPPDAASYTAYTIMHGSNKIDHPHLVRMNPLIQPILNNMNWVLPTGLTPADFERLVELDLDAIAQKDVELIDKFCRLWLLDHVPNQPIRSDGELKPILGHGRFSDAKKAAEQMLNEKVSAEYALSV